MISQFTPPGIKIVALRSGGDRDEITAGAIYTTRGMVMNLHWKTREPDAHVLLEEVRADDRGGGERGYPRDGFELATLPRVDRELEAV